jgi:hypothetical protein
MENRFDQNLVDFWRSETFFHFSLGARAIFFFNFHFLMKFHKFTRKIAILLDLIFSRFFLVFEIFGDYHDNRFSRLFGFFYGFSRFVEFFHKKVTCSQRNDLLLGS